MHQREDLVEISFDCDREGGGYARSTIDIIEWCRGWEISRDGRGYVLYDLKHASFNTRWLSTIKIWLKKAGVWESFPYRAIVDKVIYDGRMIISLMSAAKTRQENKKKG